MKDNAKQSSYFSNNNRKKPFNITAPVLAVDNKKIKNSTAPPQRNHQMPASSQICSKQPPKNNKTVSDKKNIKCKRSERVRNPLPDTINHNQCSGTLNTQRVTPARDCQCAKSEFESDPDHYLPPKKSMGLSQILLEIQQQAVTNDKPNLSCPCRSKKLKEVVPKESIANIESEDKTLGQHSLKVEEYLRVLTLYDPELPIEQSSSETLQGKCNVTDDKDSESNDYMTRLRRELEDTRKNIVDENCALLKQLQDEITEYRRQLATYQDIKCISFPPYPGADPLSCTDTHFERRSKVIINEALDITACG